MKKNQLYRSVTTHNGKFVWQLTVLGHPLRTKEHYETPEDCAVACDLVKNYLASEFKLVLPPSMGDEQFASLAYSRRGVNLSDSASVFKSLPSDVQDFIALHQDGLTAHRESAPPETMASKFRRSGMFSDPRIREWVERCEAAALEAESFSRVNSEYLFRLIDALPSRLIDAVKPLRLAQKMHEGLNCCHSQKLAARTQAISDLIAHLESDIAYARVFAVEMKAEQASVETAVETLENNRPTFS